ncbi:MAG: DNA repair protein RecO [Bacilli bacterium]|nr:DNA repair protein RecO [Bacilli bacterium]
MNIKGVIVRVTPYKESGAMINLLTKDQLLSFHARNIYKVDDKNILLTTPLMYGDFTFSDNKKSTLTFKEMSPILDTRSYMNNYAKLAAIDFLNEVTIRLFPEDEMPKIFPYLVKTLELIQEEKHVAILTLTYLATSLRLLGFGLNVDSCVLTNSKTDIVGVSYVDGGLVSRKAYRSSRHKLYSPDKINILRCIFKVKPDDLGKINFLKRDIYEILEDLLIYTYDQTGLRFKSENLIKK